MSEVPVEKRRSFRLLIAAVFGVVIALGGFTLWFWMGRTCCGAPPLDGPLVAVPSGSEVRYLDTITNVPGQDGLTYRFRFVSPTIDADKAPDDMLALCNTFAIDRLPTTGPIPNQIVITLSDRPTLFGQLSPEVTQFFEAYRVENGQCIWELF
jgi:hypothetical protein